MAQPESEQQPMTDEELEETHENLKQAFEDIAEDLADETGEPKAKFWYGEDYDYSEDGDADDGED
jgi:hypothetical protein